MKKPVISGYNGAGQPFGISMQGDKLVINAVGAEEIRVPAIQVCDLIADPSNSPRDAGLTARILALRNRPK